MKKLFLILSALTFGMVPGLLVAELNPQRCANAQVSFMTWDTQYKATLAQKGYVNPEIQKALAAAIGQINAYCEEKVNLTCADYGATGTFPNCKTIPVVTSDPGTPTDPVVTTDPGTPTDPVVTTDPGTTTDPVVTTDPGTTTDPVVTTDPGTTTDPVVTNDPGTPPGNDGSACTTKLEQIRATACAMEAAHNKRSDIVRYINSNHSILRSMGCKGFGPLHRKCN